MKFSLIEKNVGKNRNLVEDSVLISVVWSDLP